MVTNGAQWYLMIISHTNESIYVGKMVKCRLGTVKLLTEYIGQKFFNVHQGYKGGPLRKCYFLFATGFCLSQK